MNGELQRWFYFFVREMNSLLGTHWLLELEMCIVESGLDLQDYNLGDKIKLRDSFEMNLESLIKYIDSNLRKSSIYRDKKVQTSVPAENQNGW